MKWLPWLCALVYFTGFSTTLFANPQGQPQLDSKLFQELRWRSIGPFRGGRALAVTGVRGQPEVFYFGSVGGGVWRTNDAGRTWNPIFDAQSIASIGAIAVAPSNPNIIYVGTGEADMRSDISYGDGMYKSMDAGKTWEHIGLRDSRQIARILIDPSDPDKVFVAALGHAYGPNSERGIFRTRDGGKNWERVLFHDENTGAIDLAFEPGNTKNMWAALLQTRRPPWAIYPPSKGPGTGLYRSRDGGEHWEAVTGHGLPAEELGRIGIGMAASDTRRRYLIIDAKVGGLYRSDDSGENWQLVCDDNRIWQRGWYFEEVTVDPKNPDIVYVPNTSMYRSQDGGKTFMATKGAPFGDDYHALWIDPDEPLRMILGTDQGTIVTRNGGETWSSWYNQPTGQFYHVATDNREPYWVYGAQQDSGSAATASRGNNRALNFHDWRPLEAGDENGYIAPDPANPGIVYGGFVTRQDFSNEQRQQMPPSLAQTGTFRRTWTLPLVFSPTDPRVLYFGSQVLFRTSNGGSSWQIISPDLSREDPGTPGSLDMPTAADAPEGKRRGVIYTIAPSPLRKGEIWAGTSDGLIHVTQDEGKTWQDVTPPEITAWSKVTHIEASHFDAAIAYAAVDRHRLDDLRPYLYRTVDGGKTWTSITKGIPEGSFLNCVREDGERKGLLFACTEKGVFVSFDDGGLWQPLQMNLPVTSVRDLVVHGVDLVIATHGRSFWILDNITPLRQLRAENAASEAWLFKPAAAYRWRPESDQSSPIPLDEPQADNPPNGVVVDYYLKAKSDGPVQLEILDDRGSLVRKFSSNDIPAKTDPKSVEFPMYWVHDAKALSAESGMHRFVWDFRIALPAVIHSSVYGPFGPMVVAGNYTVKLTVNGKTFSQPLLVKSDPRMKISKESEIAAFHTESKILEKLASLSEALARVDDLEKQIADRKKLVTGNAELNDALTEFSSQLNSVTGVRNDFDYSLFSIPVGLSSLRQSTSAMSSLLSISESSDAGPTRDAMLAIEKWQAASDAALIRWNQFVQKDAARVNSLLQKAKLAPLPIPEPDAVTL